MAYLWGGSNAVRRFSVVLNGELKAQKVGRELVFSADLCYNGMGDIMEDLKNRKTTRLKGADYNRNQAVFLTICTKERRCILSRVVGTGVLDGPQIELTKYGQIADKYIRQLSDFYDDLSVESYAQSYPHYAVGKRRGNRTVEDAGHRRTVEDAGPYSA